MEPPVLQFAPITSGPVTGCHWREPVSISAPTFRYLNTSCVCHLCVSAQPTRLLLYRLNSPSSLSPSSYEMLRSLDHFSSPSFSSLCYSHVSLVPGSSEPGSALRCGIPRAEQQGRTSTLSLLVTLHLVPLDSFVPRARCWLGLHLLHQDPQGLFVHSCFPAAFQQLSSNPASAAARVCSSIGAALGNCLAKRQEWKSKTLYPSFQDWFKQPVSQLSYFILSLFPIFFHIFPSSTKSFFCSLQHFGNYSVL